MTLAVTFLKSLLADGPVAAEQVGKTAIGAGYSSITIERAKKKADIKAHKLGMKQGWVWSLPPEDHQKLPKNVTQLSEGLQANVMAFGKTEPYPTDDLEIF